MNPKIAAADLFCGIGGLTRGLRDAEINVRAGIDSDSLTDDLRCRRAGKRIPYDFRARVKAKFGLWTISPTAAAELQYQTSEEVWDSEASEGLSAAWNVHKWIVHGQSDFAGAGGHTLLVHRELRYGAHVFIRERSSSVQSVAKKARDTSALSTKV